LAAQRPDLVPELKFGPTYAHQLRRYVGWNFSSGAAAIPP